MGSTRHGHGMGGAASRWAQSNNSTPATSQPTMKIEIILAKRGNDVIAYNWGSSSPILKPVPGNTRPATAWLWHDEAQAIAELTAHLGCPIEVVKREGFD